MEFTEYVKVERRMTKDCKIGCMECPLSRYHNGRGCDCSVLAKVYPEEAETIVMKWAEEHPIKTRQTKFLESFPHAKTENGVLSICPNLITGETKCDNIPCHECKKRYWDEEAE